VIRKLMVLLLSGTICLLGITSALAAKYNEAPMLKTLVAAGELPPVEERLPEEPLVIPVVEEIGQYGGKINMASIDPGQWGSTWQIIHFDCLLRLAPDGKTILPSLARDWKLSEDGKSLALYLRKGVKWSDGAPFTADDLLFWWEDIILNDELTPVKPKAWSPGEQPMRMEKIDDYTVRLHFAAPYPLVALQLVRERIEFAKHHLKQFHPRYTSMEKLERMVKEGGFDYWYQLFNEKRSGFFGPQAGAGVDYPTLRSHVLKKIKGEDYLAERNPYYWKVDPAGNQLPYIDRVFTSAGIGQVEVITAKTVAGELDFNGMRTFLENYPLYKENAERGNYRILLWPSTKGNEMEIQFNLTYEKDTVLRDIFRDVRFRRAASLAIDREEINKVLYFGKAIPRQITVLPSSVYYEEEFAKAYAQYDLEQANRLLDEMGLKWDANHEWRLRPDGKKLTIVYEYFAAGETPLGPIGELIKEYWQKVGINLILKPLSSELMWTRYEANEVEMGSCWFATASDMGFPLSPEFVVPMATGFAGLWGGLWSRWYLSGGKEGEEPPEEIKKNIKLWEKMKTTVDEKERIRLGKEMLHSNAENLWTIGVVGMAPVPIIVRNNLRNVPEKIPFGWDLYFSTIAYPEQFFLKPPLLESQKD